MRKRILASGILVGLISVLVGGYTFAFFTSQATQSGNHYSTGTLKIAASGNLSFEDEEPGEEVEGTVTATNVGSLPFKYRVRVAITNPGPPGMAQKIELEIKRLGPGSSETKVFEGTLAQAASGIYLGELQPGQSHQYELELELEKDCGSQYSGQNIGYNLIWEATQPSNPGWSE